MSIPPLQFFITSGHLRLLFLLTDLATNLDFSLHTEAPRAQRSQPILLVKLQTTIHIDYFAGDKTGKRG